MCHLLSGPGLENIQPEEAADCDSHTEEESEIPNYFEGNGEEEFDSAASGAEDCEEVKLPSGDKPLYRGAKLTVSTFMLLILTFMMTHHLSGRCLSDFLDLLTFILPADSDLVPSAYLFFKYFEGSLSPVIRHYYCRVCTEALPSKDGVCPRCGPSKGADYFVRISLKDQIVRLLQRPGVYESLLYKQNRSKINEGAYEDMYDGFLYREASQKMGTTVHWISFLWNIDGFSIFKSSTYQIWPFFLSIIELPPHLRFLKENMLLGGLWFGKTKPDPNLFLKPFYDELRKLEKGFDVFIPSLGQTVLFKVALLCGTCDAPARAMIMRHKLFNGTYGCPKCLSRGEKSVRTGKVFVYPFEENLNIRTDDRHNAHLRLVQRLKKPQYGVKGPSILQPMSYISFLRSISIDMMHCVHLGVTKSLLHLWFSIKYKDEPFSMRHIEKVVSEKLCSIKPPHFFDRIPQPISKLAFWKASELQSFLLYYSLPILCKVMDQVYFNHFQLFVLGISLLCKDSVTEADIVMSQSLLDLFVREYEHWYGLRHMTFNLHCLRHLPGVVRELGPLQFTTCYQFETMNGALAHLVHGTQYAGLQVLSNFELVTRLPVFVSEMMKSEVKDFCVRMYSKCQRLKITEKLNNGISLVGYPLKNFQGNDLINEVLIVLPGKKSFYNRVKINNFLYDSYKISGTKQSSLVVYDFNGATYRGCIQVFVKVLNCGCSSVCSCPVEVYALIQKLDCSIAFKTLHSDIEIFHMHSCQRSNVIHNVPLSHISNVCVNIHLQDKLYVVDLLNKQNVQ